MTTSTRAITNDLTHLHRKTHTSRSLRLTKANSNAIQSQEKATSPHPYNPTTIIINRNNPSVNTPKNESQRPRVHLSRTTPTVSTSQSQPLPINLSTITLSKNSTNSQQKAHNNPNISNNANNNNNNNDQGNPALKWHHNWWSILIKYCSKIQYWNPIIRRCRPRSKRWLRLKSWWRDLVNRMQLFSIGFIKNQFLDFLIF